MDKPCIMRHGESVQQVLQRSVNPATIELTMSLPETAVEGTLHARVSPRDVVLYANNAMAYYLGVAKESLPGTPLEVLAGMATGEVAECFVRDPSGRASNKLVTDDFGRVFEAKTFSDGGVLDILLDEVTTAQSISRDLSFTSGTPVAALDEHELRTARLPERRYLTVSYSRMRETSRLVSRLSPVESRVIVDAFLEESSDSIKESGCTIASTAGDSVLGIFGAPRHFLDHPLRAIHAACEAVAKIGSLHTGFQRQGKELPPFTCGIWTGEVLIGTLGASACRHYTALGEPVELARRLCALARPGEILIPEQTLHHILRVLPEGWSWIKAESEYPPDISDLAWAGDEVLHVDEELQRVVYLLGPGVDEDASRAEYYFDYLWKLNLPADKICEPILRVVRPSTVGDSLEFSDENILAASAGETLGKYRLMEVVGVGGMGKVWRGVDRFGNDVAVKVLQTPSGESNEQMRRFQREAEVMARLPHRNICRVYEINEFEGIHYIAMEYVDGLTLADVLYSRGGPDSENVEDLPTLIQSIQRSHASQASATENQSEQKPTRLPTARILPVQQTLALVLKVSEAIQFAHEHGVLHRDVKPGNILLRKDGEPLVADFGLAKMKTPDATQSLSVTGNVVGTLENMPPEQAESSRDVDERADVYSIGTVLYLMLTAHRHFAATGNIVNDAQALQGHEPVRVRQYNPRIDPDLELITMKALRNDPAQRYPSVAALHADLERYLHGEVVAAKPVSALDLTKKLINRNPTASIITAASVLLVAGIITASLWTLSDRLNRERLAREEAEELRIIAEENESLAAEKQRVAEEKEQEAVEYARRAKRSEREARKQSLIAEKALQEKIAAEEEAKAIEAQRLQLERESEGHSTALAEAQRKTDALEQQLEILRAAETTPTRPPRRARLDAQTIRNAQEALRDAIETLRFELSPRNLEHLNSSPEDVLSRVDTALEQVSSAIAVDADLPLAWLVKGRLHLALMEFKWAEQSFRAAEAAAEARGQADLVEEAGQLRSFASTGRPGFGSRVVQLAEPLLASPNFLDQAAGRGMTFFGSHGQLRGNFAPEFNPFERQPGSKELAATLMAANELETMPKVIRSSLGNSYSVAITGDAPDLSSLSGLPVIRLAIENASVADWVNVLNFELTEFNVNGSQFREVPPHARAFSKLESFQAKGSKIYSLEFLRTARRLGELDISESSIWQLAPLMNCPGLRSLNIEGTRIADLHLLSRLPIESLTVSRNPNSELLDVLRNHRTLQVIRTPQDPENMPVGSFFDKYQREPKSAQGEAAGAAAGSTSTQP